MNQHSDDKDDSMKHPGNMQIILKSGTNEENFYSSKNISKANKHESEEYGILDYQPEA